MLLLKPPRPSRTLVTRLCADRCCTKPFDPEVVRASVRRASERTALMRENAALKTTVRKLEGADEIRGTGPAIATVRELIMQVAPSSTTVLITGETGAGKELVARAIHRNSTRSAKPFIAINCAAVTETLLESELFGHERGAFTGADRARAGLFEAAHQGTVFLDEVAEMSPAAQAKLLRVLADGEIQRVGSSSTRRVDVRVLAATYRNLSDRLIQDVSGRAYIIAWQPFPFGCPRFENGRTTSPISARVFASESPMI